MIDFYNQEIDEVISYLKTDKTTGLTTAEVKKRLEETGYNQLVEKRRKSFLSMFLAQFKSFMVIVLLIGAFISGILGVYNGEGFLDTFVILGILILNAFIGAFQEKRAESSLEALKNMASPATKVLRDGDISEIPTRNLVPGDIVILETGAVIPSDLRLIEAVNLKIQESSLTGESVPVDKTSQCIKQENIEIGDRINMAFSTGVVTYGRGMGVVVKTGMQTEVGKIAGMLQDTIEIETPMSRRLNQLGRTLGIAALIICSVIFLVGILYGNPILDMFMTAVSLAVAAIPEGLPAVSTIVLAIGVQRLVKRNAIIRTLPSVETLGSATVICSDKTGTLTQNKMTVVAAYVNHKKDLINRTAPANELNPEEHRLLSVSVLCTDARMKIQDDGKIDYSGDPTETALLELGVLYGVYKDKFEKEHPRIAEIPFDSERKRMTTVNRLSDNYIRVNVKGGLEEVLCVCNSIVINGEIKPISEQDIELIRKSNEEMADSALRVLAMAYKDMSGVSGSVETDNLENELIFIGMLGMIDPARPEVLDAVHKCNTAGIKPVMITGDHKNTALAIARELKIYKEGNLSITGAELEKLSDEELAANISRYTVYARVAPEHKVRIVKAWQSHNEIVAMTGDGVNDAPALKQADIGAAMGITGTDVAKGAADMVLTDDNFATIVSAVEEGRRIYDNILKAIQFLISCNIGEILLLFVTSVLNLGVPLLPIHILWVNLVTDSLPALALSFDPADKDVMKRRPRKTTRGFMTKGMIYRIIYQGTMIGCLPLAAFLIGLREHDIVLGQTMAFAVLMLAQLTHVRNIHSTTELSLKTNPMKNKPLIGAILISAAIALIVLLVPPIRDAFKLTEMDINHWIIVLLLSLVPIPVVDLFKFFKINTTRDEKEKYQE